MDFYELETCVETWAADKGILEKATPMAQALKTLEEVGELMFAIEKESETKEDNGAEIMDAIGDIAVTLIIQCKMQGMTLEQCLEHAWLQIKDRKGKMVNGVFIKENTGA